MERMLRQYVRVADREHWCDRCCQYIEPGEMYEGRVMLTLIRATGKRAILVIKYHIHPSCDWPPDPAYEDDADMLLDLAA